MKLNHRFVWLNKRYLLSKQVAKALIDITCSYKAVRFVEHINTGLNELYITLNSSHYVKEWL